MMNNNVTKSAAEYSFEEIENLSHNIFKKMAQLSITLPDLAKMIGMEYQTLWRIAYQKDNYVPNLRALFPIANFFNVSVADLLKNPNMPQYIPMITINDVGHYLQPHSNSPFPGTKKILSNEYIHQKAFAINVKSNYLGSPLETTYICKPYSIITSDNHLLFTYEKKRYYFAKINSIEEKKVVCTDIQSSVLLEFEPHLMEVLAIAIRQIVDNDLL